MKNLLSSESVCVFGHSNTTIGLGQLEENPLEGINLEGRNLCGNKPVYPNAKVVSAKVLDIQREIFARDTFLSYRHSVLHVLFTGLRTLTAKTLQKNHKDPNKGNLEIPEVVELHEVCRPAVAVLRHLLILIVLHP